VNLSALLVAVKIVVYFDSKLVGSHALTHEAAPFHLDQIVVQRVAEREEFSLNCLCPIRVARALTVFLL